MKYLIYILTFLTMGITYAQSNIKVNEKAPKINITHWIENVPTNKSLDNKFTVLEFWATWCGPCIAAVPHMNKIQSEFNNKDLVYISITDESVEKVKRSLKRIDFKSIVVTDLTKETQINFGDGKKGLDTYPLTVLIDNKGIIKWIGEPKKLNSKIMSEFLANAKTENKDNELKKTEIQIEQNTTLSFKELLINNEIANYFDIQEAKSTEKFKKTLGTKIISLKAYSLEEIYSDILNIKPDHINVPTDFQDKRFDLLYKNIEEGSNLELLENNILNKLELEKNSVFKSIKINMVSIQDESLLEETLEQRFSAKSDADDKIIFTAFTIDNTLDELSNLSSASFKANEDNDTKFDFIIGIKTKEDIINSLKTYGLSVEEKEENSEYISLLSRE